MEMPKKDHEPVQPEADKPVKLHNASLAAAANAMVQVHESEKIVGAAAQEEIDRWKKATYLLIGAILTQHGRKAVELTARELKKFEAGDKEVVYVPTQKGNFRYELRKKPKVKHGQADVH